MTNTCKNCIHFKKSQRELNYWDTIGFCVNPKFEFNTIEGRLIGVLDRENIKDVEGNCSHDFETANVRVKTKSIYSLAVSEDFGCIFREENKKQK